MGKRLWGAPVVEDGLGFRGSFASSESVSQREQCPPIGIRTAPADSFPPPLLLPDLIHLNPISMANVGNPHD